MKIKKVHIMEFLCISIALLMILSGCGRYTVEKTIEKLIDAENKSIENASQSVNTGDNIPIGEYSALKWPDWVPKSIPVYKYGDLWHYDKFNDSSASLYLTAINLKKDPFNAYISELKTKGWVEEEGWTNLADDENTQIIRMTHSKDNLFLTYNVTASDDEVYGTIFYDADYADIDDEETGDGSYTYEIDGEDGVSGIISNEEIPDGYPDNFCPLYPGADLLAAQNIADEDMSMYTIMLVSKDDIDDVADFYSSNENLSMKLGDYVIGLESEDEKMTAQIQISEAESEHADMGYKTFIMMNVIVN